MTRFANILIAASLAASASLAACSSGGNSPTDSGNPSPSDQAISVGVGETVAVGTTGVTIAFLRVEEDSRCPLNALCVWEGNGKVALTLASGYGASKSVSLNTTTEPRRTDFAGLEIQLSALAPHPTGEPIDPEAYVATFRIEQN